MNKKELIAKLETRTGVSQDVIETVLNHTMDEIGRRIAEKDCVSLSGYGIFEPRPRRGGISRDSRVRWMTDEPPKMSVVFKAGKELRKVMNAPIPKPPKACLD